MIKIIGITGSLRSGSFNTALLRAATAFVPSGVALEIATLKDIPLYNADIETAEGIPQAVITLQAQIAAADGLLLATPEYNNSMPGVFKKCNRLAVAATERDCTCFWWSSSYDNRCDTGRIRYSSVPKRLVACTSNIRHASLVRRAANGVPGASSFQRIR